MECSQGLQYNPHSSFDIQLTNERYIKSSSQWVDSCVLNMKSVRGPQYRIVLNSRGDNGYDTHSGFIN